MHTDFGRAFTHGLRLTRPTEVLDLAVEPLGTLDVGAAGVWVFDPGSSPVDPPFALPAGRYGVEVGVVSASSGKAARRLTTAVRAALPDAVVVEWRDVGTVSCDSGSVALSSSGQRAGALECRAGFGDGGYGCFLGFDARGAAVAFVVDFFVLVGPDEVRLALAPDARGRIIDPRLDEAGLVMTATDAGFALDASRRVSPEVTDFALMVFDARGEPMICNGTSQGTSWSWDRPHPSMKRLELWFQRAIIAY